ncbi:alpha-amylase family glycosyl hydrolase [Paraburkholderia fynbosensis]|uniref:Alpha-1,4-glucan:maltose-1-phosphate maltosyltransferase n=1 Tax=Paraburkholderia fynbosensis TaxID=1200993 RepID=A0A6J5GHN9_9BURK|nr:alpha-amylase family glycosyl hydrolase [Paraburkholderia fynbosensis]CAB3800443.1 Alpha-1,4-glucan:maltose-1-phosphate maltosyltransferase [Paraburkholderia fynbosensis]
MSDVRYPSLYQINTRVWLTDLSRALGRRATLDDIPDAELDRLAELGFDWVWLLSVWQTGPAAQAISRAHAGWRREFAETLPDLADDDIAGSGFAIQAYTVHRDLGGAEALARLRQRMQQRGLKLMLDFVPNHMAPDHDWIDTHPDYFVPGSEADLARAPHNYCRVQTKNGPLIFAHGRDPYFDGWPDTLQLNYGNPALQQAMIDELKRIAGQCDGVRCDMAMLVLPDVFERTWGIRTEPFWPKAAEAVRREHPRFLLMAEVYWDLEWTMQQQGFDYAYDKQLYDRLRDTHARPVREHLYAGLDYQDKLARFLENHDEPRTAATFEPAMHEAGAIVTFLSPGLRFFHQGQFEGRKKRISPHLVRAPQEPVDASVQGFYVKLLAALRQPVFRDGTWSLIELVPAWDGNWTSDCFIAWCWQRDDGERRLVVVNYAGNQSQCYIRMPFVDVIGRTVRLRDLMGSASLDRDGDEVATRGLYLDLPPWGYHVFEVTAAT